MDAVDPVVQQDNTVEPVDPSPEIKAVAQKIDEGKTEEGKEGAAEGKEAAGAVTAAAAAAVAVAVGSLAAQV